MRTHTFKQVLSGFLFIVLFSLIPQVAVADSASLNPRQENIGISGEWQGSDGNIYVITQTGSDFVMILKGTRQEFIGNISGKQLRAIFTTRTGESWLTGQITEIGANDQATKIRWSNSLVLSRGIERQIAKPIERIERSKPETLRLNRDREIQNQLPDVSGFWRGSDGSQYEIQQNGEQFGVFNVTLTRRGRGVFENGQPQVDWDLRGQQPLKGRVTEIDDRRRALKIEWENGVVFTRPVGPATEHFEPNRPGKEPRVGDPDRPEFKERPEPEPPREERERPEQEPGRPRDENQERNNQERPIDISGRWFSSLGPTFEIAQHEAGFEWRVPDSRIFAHGNIEGRRLRAEWVEGERQINVEGNVIELNPEWRASIIEWSDGVVFSREPFPNAERPRIERRPEVERPERLIPNEGDQERFPNIRRVEEAVGRLRQYHFRIEYNPGIFYEGEVDPAENRQYFQIGKTADGAAIAEVFFDRERGYGRKLGRNDWMNIAVTPLPNNIMQALELLRRGEIVSIAEVQDFWLVEFRPTNVLPLENPELFFTELVGETGCCKEQEFIERAIQRAQGAMTQVWMRISQEDFLIRELKTVITFSNGEQAKQTIMFSPAKGPIPQIPDLARAADSPAIRAEMLLLEIHIIGGWYDSKTHSPWAQSSLNLIKSTDTEGQYAELYHSSWSTEEYTEQIASKVSKPDYLKHHPIVLGAYYEDETGAMPQFFADWFKDDADYKSNKSYYWDPAGYFRDYHHYGYKGVGLKYEWFYVFRGTPPNRTMPGDRYYHGRDWGFGYNRIDENLNRMTWTEAIKQYNSYTFEGKRRAYLMLGFVTHLLQDQGQPDHANNAAHPGSGMDEEEAYNRYSYCHLIAAEAAVAAVAACSSTGIGSLFSAICGGTAYGIAYGACEASIDPNEMGYEKLIAEKWRISRVMTEIKNTGVVKKGNYNAFFDAVGSEALNAMKNAGLKSILGCGTLTVPPMSIPGADPDIQSDDPNAVKPYFQMTDELVPSIITCSAGLMEHFYDIVNYPPYVQRVAIVQWEAGATPREFAFFANDKDQCVRYDAEWVMSSGKRTLQYNVTTQQLSLDRPAYVFILFGPADIKPIESGREMRDVKLRLTGTYTLNGKPIDIEVKLHAGDDPNLGTYYWGSFEACNCGKDPYTLTMNITGKDNGPHLASRSPSGAELDGDPATVAYVDHTQYPQYPIKNYEYGTDTNHTIKVSVFNWKLDIQPQAVIISPLSKIAQAEVVLQIKQKSYNCQWEPFESLPCCPVEWRLNDEVTEVGKSGTLKLRETGLDVALTSSVNGKATLTIAAMQKRYKSTAYKIEVEYSVGESPNVTSGSVYIQVAVK